MKRFIIAAFVSGSLLTPAVALADHVGREFDTRGECEQFVKDTRNLNRKEGQAARKDGFDFNSGEANKNSKLRCEERNGKFVTVED
jgi:hypothetical protein